MEVTEVKQEPIEHMDPTEYEENVLNKIEKPAVNKVNGLCCLELIFFYCISLNQMCK